MSSLSGKTSSEGMKLVCMASMAAGVLGGAVLAAIAAHIPVLTPAWCKPEAATAVYVLLITMKLNPEMGGAKKFKEAWASLAADVKAKEKNCLSYEVADSSDEPDSIIIYERYKSKRDLDETHNNGVVFKAFGKRIHEGDLKGLVVSRTRSTFIESNVGFMTRA
jgi:quinol monooxygenase YgiN